MNKIIFLLPLFLLMHFVSSHFQKKSEVNLKNSIKLIWKSTRKEIRKLLENIAVKH